MNETPSKGYWRATYRTLNVGGPTRYVDHLFHLLPPPPSRCVSYHHTTRLQLEPGPFVDRLQESSSVVRETNTGASVVIALIATAPALTTATRGLGLPG